MYGPGGPVPASGLPARKVSSQRNNRIHISFSSPDLKNHLVLRTTISLFPLLVAVPTFVLIMIGYTPNRYEMEISEDFIQEISPHNETSFLMAPEEKVRDIVWLTS